MRRKAVLFFLFNEAFKPFKKKSNLGHRHRIGRRTDSIVDRWTLVDVKSVACLSAAWSAVTRLASADVTQAPLTSPGEPWQAPSSQTSETAEYQLSDRAWRRYDVERNRKRRTVAHVFHVQLRAHELPFDVLIGLHQVYKQLHIIYGGREYGARRQYFLHHVHWLSLLSSRGCYQRTVGSQIAKNVRWHNIWRVISIIRVRVLLQVLYSRCCTPGVLLVIF